MDHREQLVDTRVKDVLRTKGTLQKDADVLSASPTTIVYDCIDRMASNDFGSILVMDDGDIAGIFTERDYMRNLALEGRSSQATEVREVMTHDVVTVTPDTHLEKCLDLMTDIECRHLPVVGETGASQTSSPCATAPGRSPRLRSRKPSNSATSLRALIRFDFSPG